MICEVKLPLLSSLLDSAQGAESWQSTNQAIDCHDFATQSLAMTKRHESTRFTQTKKA